MFVIDGQIGRPNVSSAYQPLTIRIGFAAIAVMFAAVVAHGILIDGWVRAIFDRTIFRRLGAYSYFMYLFHWTVGNFAARAIVAWIGNPGPLWIYAIQFILTVTAAHLSFVALERPATRLRRRFPFQTPRAPAPPHQTTHDARVASPIV